MLSCSASRRSKDVAGPPRSAPARLLRQGQEVLGAPSLSLGLAAPSSLSRAYSWMVSSIHKARPLSGPSSCLKRLLSSSEERPRGDGGRWLAAPVLGAGHHPRHRGPRGGPRLTTKHYGREVPRVGVGWYWFGPVAYVDTSDMWLEGSLASDSRERRGPLHQPRARWSSRRWWPGSSQAPCSRRRSGSSRSCPTLRYCSTSIP